MFAVRCVVLVCCWSVTVLASQAEPKTMTVDINKLYNGYHVTQKAVASLKAGQAAYAKERDERRKAIEEVTGKLKAVITKLRAKAMPKTEKDNLTEEYEELVSQYNALSKDFQESDRDKLRETREKIAIARRKGLNEITAVVRKFAKDHKYQWVMETSGVSNTQISPLVYARKTEDKTGEILTILNKDAPKPGNKEEEKKDASETGE